MKVSEAIDQLKIGDTVWVKGEVEYIDKSGALPLYLKFAETTKYFAEKDEISLTEPQAEKLEVTQEFADWFEKSMMWKHDGSWAAKEIAGYGWGAYMHNPETGEELLPKKYPWVEVVQNNKEKHIKAIYDGYTVEQPKRWVVKFKYAETDFYFIGWSDIYKTDDNPFAPNGYAEKDKDRVFMFDDRAKAEAVATLVEGSVEEV